MFTYIILVLIITISIIRFYRNRAFFKTLSKKEWLQYIAAVLLACTIVVTFIFVGAELIEPIEIGWINTILRIVIIFIGLGIAGFLLEKWLPEKVKALYKWK